MTRTLVLTMACFSLWFATSGQRASAQTASLTRAQLEALLADRDAVIIDLQQKVNRLLDRVTALENPVQTDLPNAKEADDNAEVSPATPVVPAPSGARSDRSLRLVVDERAAERALERTLVQTGALLLPKGTFEFDPMLSHTVTEGGVSVALDAADGAVLGSSHFRRRVASLDLTARIGLPKDTQLEIGVPYLSVTEHYTFTSDGSAIATSDSSGRGLGDLRIGFAKTLLRENGWRPDMVGRISYGFGNGDISEDGVLLGSGFEYIDASLSFVKRRDPLALLFSIGYTSTAQEEGIDPGDVYSLSFGTALALSPETSLFGSLTYRSFDKTELDGEEIPDFDEDVAAINLGLSTVLRRGRLLNVSTQIGISEQAPDYSLAFSIPMQW